MEGAARLLSEHRFQELSQIGALMEVLEHRRALLGVLRESLTEPSVYLRIGSENAAPGAALARASWRRTTASRGATSAPCP